MRHFQVPSRAVWATGPFRGRLNWGSRQPLNHQLVVIFHTIFVPSAFVNRTQAHGPQPWTRGAENKQKKEDVQSMHHFPVPVPETQLAFSKQLSSYPWAHRGQELQRLRQTGPGQGRRRILRRTGGR